MPTHEYFGHTYNPDDFDTGTDTDTDTEQTKPPPLRQQQQQQRKVTNKINQPTHPPYSSSSSSAKAFNPRYFQAYTTRKKETVERNDLMLFRLDNPIPQNVEEENRRVLDLMNVDDDRRGGLMLLRVGGSKVQKMYDRHNNNCGQDDEDDTSYRYREQQRKYDEKTSDLQDQLAAATCLQSLYRGHTGRLNASSKLSQFNSEKISALKIQCLYRQKVSHRSYLIHKSLNDDKKSIASVLIQTLYRGNVHRKSYLHKLYTLKSRQTSATLLQANIRGRRCRQNLKNKKRERGSTMASSNGWGESDSGLGLLIDLSGFKCKFKFANVVDVKGKDDKSGRKEVDVKSSLSFKAWDRNAVGDDTENENPLLNEMREGTISLAEQLARLEAMAEDLEEDFTKTSDKLKSYKDQYDVDFGRNKSKQVNSRINMVDYENEAIRLRESNKQVLLRRRKNDDFLRAEKERERIVYEAGLEADSDIQACYKMIEELQVNLYGDRAIGREKGDSV